MSITNNPNNTNNTKKIYEMTIEEMDEFISFHLPIKIDLKKGFGEVFTCRSLIDKMLDELPDSVWTNPHLKWLEPTCGVGNFMLVVYIRLMSGLVAWELDATKRSKHIIQNMLYMVEMNAANVDVCLALFGDRANIKCSDFLLVDGDYGNGFNIILGNLPFQSKSCLGGKSKLYEKITDKCLDCLSLENGYLLLITPDNIFSGGSKIYKRLLQTTSVCVINLHKQNQLCFPKIQQYICYFLAEKNKNNLVKATKIIQNDGVDMAVDLQLRPVNPIRNWNFETESLVKKYISNTKNNIVYNRGKSINQYFRANDVEWNMNMYLLIYTPTEFLYTPEKELATGIGIKKIVVFSISTKFEFKTDFGGEYGVGPNTFYIPIENMDEGIQWVQFLSGLEYKSLCLATKTNRQFLKNACMQYLKIL